MFFSTLLDEFFQKFVLSMMKKKEGDDLYGSLLDSNLGVFVAPKSIFSTNSLFDSK